MAKYCPECANPIIDGNMPFCPKCGAKLPITSPEVQPPENSEKTKDFKFGIGIMDAFMDVLNYFDPAEVKPKTRKHRIMQTKKSLYFSTVCSLFIPGLGQIYNGRDVKGVGIGILIIFLIYFSKPLALIVWLIGIIDAYHDSDQINSDKSPYKPTDNGNMIIYGILAVFLIWGSLNVSNAVQSSSTGNSFGKSYSASSGQIVPIMTESQTDRNIRISNEIVANYHNTHTYSLNDMYVCGDMASDVWDMLKTQGINAKINIGKIDADITNIKDADHAWVLAEVTPNSYLALETTAGYSVLKSENPRYYSGVSFNNPGQLKKYMQLNRQRKDAIDKYNSANADYNNFVIQYNKANFLTQLSWKGQLDDKKLILNQRTQDLYDNNQQINVLLSSL
jgi:TM2 domain-containing membrane protein YozV